MWLSKFYGIVDSSLSYLRTPSPPETNPASPLLLTRWRCSNSRAVKLCSPSNSRSSIGYVLDHIELKQYACTPRHLTIALWTTATTTHTLSASWHSYSIAHLYSSAIKSWWRSYSQTGPSITCKAHLDWRSSSFENEILDPIAAEACHGWLQPPYFALDHILINVDEN